MKLLNIYRYIILCVFLLITITGAGEEQSLKPSDYSGLRFLPEARVALSPAYVQNDKSYISLSRYISVDVLRYGLFSFSFSTYEILEYRKNRDTLSPESIYYNMEYLNIRGDTSYGRAFFFIDHRCMNYADISNPPPRLRWYGYGAGWQSSGMIIGAKDARHGLSIFSSDDYINFSAAARKPIYTEYYPYDNIADLMLRFDYYLTPGIIPYISGKGEIFFSDKVEWNRTVELGMRFVYGNTDITPFAEYAYITDRVISSSGRKSMYSAGLKIEASLYEENSNAGVNLFQKSIFYLSPELHLQGSYSKYIDDSDRNYRSDILVALNFLRIKSISLFWNSSLIHSSPREDSGLYPRYIDYYNETGLTIQIKKVFLLEPLYRYTGYGEGNTVDTGGYTYHYVGTRLRTTGLKPGYINSRVCGKFTNGFSLLFSTEGELSAGWISGHETGKKSYIIESTIREDIFSYKSIVQYISLNASIKKGEIPESRKTVKEVKPECGIRVNRNLIFMLFYQYIHREPENDDYDINSEYHLAGVRISI